MSAPAVLLDACTLVPIRLASCLLALAEAGLLVPLWSDEILDEVERSLPKLKGMTAQRAKRRVAAMRQAFDDEASVDGYRGLIPHLTCDPKDRHVLAAAIKGGADVLLTFNLKDFPATSAEPHGVTVQHPDVFLPDLLRNDAHSVLEATRIDAARHRHPPTTMGEYFAGLAGVAPTFAQLAQDALAGDDGVSFCEHPHGRRRDLGAQDGPSELKHSPRQNVLLEMRERVGDDAVDLVIAPRMDVGKAADVP